MAAGPVSGCHRLMSFVQGQVGCSLSQTPGQDLCWGMRRRHPTGARSGSPGELVPSSQAVGGSGAV